MDERPGLNPRRLLRLMREAVGRCRLDVSGAVVLTEAASGVYVVTPILAALAGAERVFAVTRSTPYGTPEEVRARTLALAEQAGVPGRITVLDSKPPEIVAQADIITNSGHVRPIDAEMVGWMKPGAVIPLMYEAWEFRPADVDLAACRAKGIAVAGTNERHPAVDVFSYLGVMAVKLLHDAGVAVHGSRLLVLCDNPFAPYIHRGLAGAGATVVIRERVAEGDDTREGFDAVVIALRPQNKPVIGPREAEWLAASAPGAVVAQFWGDVDRQALAVRGVPVWPTVASRQGHMGILPAAVGPEPIVRLQAGGLKVGEVLSARDLQRDAQAAQYVQWFEGDERRQATGRRPV